MPKKRLSDAFLRNLKPPRSGQVSYFETMQTGLSLVLVVSYGGTKAFRVMTYVNGKAQSRKLGTYPQMTLTDARDQAREYFKSPEKVTARAAVGTFKEVADKWLKRHVQGRLRSEYDITRQLTAYVYPRWAERRFLDIRRREVNELLDHIADNHGKAQADAVLATLRSIMTFHQSKDDDYTSPIVRGMKRNTGAKPRARILSDDELRKLWKAADASGMFGALVKMLLLTAQRRDKVGTMKWTDIKDDIWTIAVEEREKGTPGNLRLPALALSVLETLPRVLGNDYVFVSGRGEGPFNGYSKCKLRLGNDSGVKDWTLHDLRRTARSLMSRAGVRPDIAERVLGHAIAGVEGVYDRHHYETEKADALERLATLITTILAPKGAKVVALVGPKGARVLR